MIFDAFSILYFTTVLLTVVVGIFLLSGRQMARTKNNSERKQIDTAIASNSNKKFRKDIKKKVEEVCYFKSLYVPKFTDCMVISDHANAPYVHRLIAFDEILHECDRQLERINPELIRYQGESTYSFLIRLKTIALPDLSESLINQIGYLHEWCRHQTFPNFEAKQLEQLRGLLKEFVKLLNDNQKHLSEIRCNASSLNSHISQINLFKRLRKHRLSNSVDKTAYTTLPSNGFDRPKAKSPLIRSILPTTIHDIDTGTSNLQPFAETNSDSFKPNPPAISPPTNQTTLSPILLPNDMTKVVGAAVPPTHQNNIPFSSPVLNDEEKVKKEELIEKEIKTKIISDTKNQTVSEPHILDGKCVCLQYYSGDSCQTLVCANGGKIMAKIGNGKKVCECPFPQITGNFCEFIKCANGGNPLRNEAKCECNSRWYDGRFCENYALTGMAMFALPIALMIIIIIVCVACQLDLCGRRRNVSVHGGNRRNRRARGTELTSTTSSYPINQRNYPVTAVVLSPERDRWATENFLQECRQQRMTHDELARRRRQIRSVIVPNEFAEPSETSKPLEPPPSYEAALENGLPSAPLPMSFNPNAQPPPPPAYNTLDPNTRLTNNR
uniref:EGF-like domain-containing protein n=1 Tax=Rhabditophanes sp. KR3021 TaxID=114890 RepID=A0AC35UFN2_9BILA